jgi:hypothetical protein
MKANAGDSYYFSNIHLYGDGLHGKTGGKNIMMACKTFLSPKSAMALTTKKNYIGKIYSQKPKQTNLKKSEKVCLPGEDGIIDGPSLF